MNTKDEKSGDAHIPTMGQIRKGDTFWDPTDKQFVTCYGILYKEDTKRDRDYVMVHPVGEPDMQSCYGVEVNQLRFRKGE